MGLLMEGGTCSRIRGLEADEAALVGVGGRHAAHGGLAGARASHAPAERRSSKVRARSCCRPTDIRGATLPPPREQWRDIGVDLHLAPASPMGQVERWGRSACSLAPTHSPGGGVTQVDATVRMHGFDASAPERGKSGAAPGCGNARSDSLNPGESLLRLASLRRHEARSHGTWMVPRARGGPQILLSRPGVDEASGMSGIRQGHPCRVAYGLNRRLALSNAL